MVYKGNNVVGALMNIPIFVGTFSVMTDFLVLEDMDAYRDEIMGDVIFGEPFLIEVGIKTKRFEGKITIYNGDDEVTYQMVRSHPRTLEAKVYSLYFPSSVSFSILDAVGNLPHCKGNGILVVKSHVILLLSELLVNLKNEELLKELSRNYYDHEDGETTPRFEVFV
ncbi:hypothetical protein Tco_0561112 [Tanacetum coccineum]